MTLINRIENFKKEAKALKSKKEEITKHLDRNQEKIAYHVRELKKLEKQTGSFDRELKKLNIYKTLEQRKTLKIDADIKRLEKDISRLERQENRKMIQ
jgi:chromosome segregation ATPase